MALGVGECLLAVDGHSRPDVLADALEQAGGRRRRWQIDVLDAIHARRGLGRLVDTRRVARFRGCRKRHTGGQRHFERGITQDGLRLPRPLYRGHAQEPRHDNGPSKSTHMGAILPQPTNPPGPTSYVH